MYPNLSPRHKLMMSTLLTATTLFASAAHSVGTKDGGGGAAIVCFQDLTDKLTVEARLVENQLLKENLPKAREGLKDVFRGIDFNKLTVKLFDLEQNRQHGLSEVEDTIIKSTENEDVILEQRMSILRSKTNFYEKLKEVLDGPLAKRNWRGSTTGVVEIGDANPSQTFDEKCLLMQIAKQDRLKVTYDPRLVGRMDQVNRAALKVHEAIVRLTKIEGKDDDTVAAQEVTGLIFSTDLEEMDGFQINEILSKASIKLAASAKVSFSVGGVTVVFKAHSPDSFSYHEKGQLKGGKLWSDTVIDGILFAATVEQEFKRFYLDDEIEFYPSGKVTKGYVAEATRINGLVIPANSKIELYENGSLNFATKVDGGHTFKVKDGTPRICYGSIRLDREGNLTECAGQRP